MAIWIAVPGLPPSLEMLPSVLYVRHPRLLHGDDHCVGDTDPSDEEGDATKGEEQCGECFVDGDLGGKGVRARLTATYFRGSRG
jgi:hypothetical protein